MKFSTLSICVLLSAATIFAATPPRRFGGGALTRSVQNETFAAIDRASDWLVGQQNADGSFGTNDVRLTSICALAISGGTLELPPRLQASVEKAVGWLESNCCTNVNDISATAWREIALTVLSTNKFETSPQISAPFVSTNVPAEYAVSTIWPICEAKLMRGLPITSPVAISSNNIVRLVSEAETSAPDKKVLKPILGTAARDFLEGKYDIPLSDPAAAWWFARSVNRISEGELFIIADNKVLGINWRRTLAGRWISSQKSDEYGNGFWDKSVERTAFSVLLLNEL